MDWAYGVLTVPARRNTLLVGTLCSLNRAGFTLPRLFIDGEKGWEEPTSQWLAQRSPWFVNIQTTTRWPKVGVHGNWVLSLYELYVRQPRADRYALFQDDILVCRDLREYLEGFEGGDMHRSYLNCYTADSPPATGNVELARRHGRDGWFRSNQRGSGALALVFDNEGVRTLLASRLMTSRPYDDPTRGWRAVDGGISEALCRSDQLHVHRQPYTEWCHRPSLVQHVGYDSTISAKVDALVTDVPEPKRWPPGSGAPDWRGEDYSPLPLLVGHGRPKMSHEEWVRERDAIVRAVAADEERIRVDPVNADIYRRAIANYRVRLREHERLHPG